MPKEFTIVPTGGDSLKTIELKLADLETRVAKRARYFDKKSYENPDAPEYIYAADELEDILCDVEDITQTLVLPESTVVASLPRSVEILADRDPEGSAHMGRYETAIDPVDSFTDAIETNLDMIEGNLNNHQVKNLTEGMLFEVAVFIDAIERNRVL